MKPSTNYLIRRTHRWLGLLIGIQFLAWTMGGLYFAWSDLDEVHGDYEKNPPALLDARQEYVSPKTVLDSLKNEAAVDSLVDLRLVSILGKPCWQISFLTKQEGQSVKQIRLADAQTASIRPPLTQEEALQVAVGRYAGKGKIKSVEYLTEVGKHHEYREDPLPAVAVTFDDPRGTTVYVATELGTVQKFRNQPWRRFDFFWMLHTMDYQGRDNIGNWLLRCFSILGLATVLSGLVLFFISRKKPAAGSER